MNKRTLIINSSSDYIDFALNLCNLKPSTTQLALLKHQTIESLAADERVDCPIALSRLERVAIVCAWYLELLALLLIVRSTQT